MLLCVESRGGPLRACHRLGRELGQAEVKDFGVATIRDEDVRGFNVAMNDSFAVRGIECVGDLDAKRKHSVHFHGTPGNAVLQGLPLQELHHDKRFPVLFSGVIDRADIGVIQCRRGPAPRVGTGQEPADRVLHPRAGT